MEFLRGMVNNQTETAFKLLRIDDIAFKSVIDRAVWSKSTLIMLTTTMTSSGSTLPLVITRQSREIVVSSMKNAVKLVRLSSSLLYKISTVLLKYGINMLQLCNLCISQLESFTRAQEEGE